MSENNRQGSREPVFRKQFVIILVIIAFIMGISLDRLLTRPTGDGSGRSSTTQDTVYDVMMNDWYFGKDIENLDQKLNDAAIRGMVDSGGDIHTSYMSSEETQDFLDSLNNTLVGIGISYQMYGGQAQVRNVLNGSPAESYGILTGDLIRAVDGQKVDGLTTTEIKNLVTGPEGTKVTVTIQRGAEIFDLTLVRARILISVSSTVLPDGTGYITMSSFSDGTAEELKEHLDEMKNKGVTRLILDLRDNGGGYLDTLIKVASFFLDKGQTILTETYRNGKTDTLTAKSGKYDFEKIVLIQNENSASCTEVFAAALRENQGIEIVGTTSYGKGTVQTTIGFSDGSALKYTIAQWLTPGGEWINGVGVAPDYEVKLDDALVNYLAPVEEGVTYQYDSVSEWNRYAQQILKFLKYDVDRTDGYFSQQTMDSLKQFQTDNGLEAAGILDTNTSITLVSTMLRKWDQEPLVYDAQVIKALEVVHGE